MRLVSLDVAGFRAFSTRVKFDLDANVVLLTGPNGSGKTSLFDAVLWALTGSVSRFEDERQKVVSMYSTAREASVTIVLRDRTGDTIEVTRTYSEGADASRLLMRTSGGLSEGASATPDLLRRLWPPALVSDDPPSTFGVAFTRSVYLQQDLVREFLTTDSEETRFRVLSELVGIGRLTDFIRALESARNRWSRTGTREATDLAALEKRVNSLRERLSDLSQETKNQHEPSNRWTKWWVHAADLGFQGDLPQYGSLESLTRLDRILRQAQDARRAVQRRIAELRGLMKDLEEAGTRRSNQDADRVVISTRAKNLERQIHEVEERLRLAEAAVNAEQAPLLQVADARDEMQTLAQLALRHLGAKCPVCEQEYDIAKVRRRLERLAKRKDQKAVTSVPDSSSQLRRELETVRFQEASAQAELRRFDSELTRAIEWQGLLQRRLQELSVETSPNVKGAVGKEEELASRRLLELNSLISEGETLSLQSARAAEDAQRAELEDELKRELRNLESLRDDVDAHARTYELASTLITQTRQVAWKSVGDRVKAIGPLVDRIYARMDPHPALTRVILDTATTGQRGKVSILLGDRSRPDALVRPLPVLSSSQMNVLAVSIFLAFSLGVRDTPLDSALLDDPLQTMDDVNLLGLVDTFRRARSTKQLLLSTHDDRLAGLLSRKLRPVGEGDRTIELRFGSWTPSGPEVDHREIVPSRPITVLAA